MGAILQSNLSDRDLVFLSNELRRGQLPDELAYMIEQVANHFYDRSISSDSNSNVKLAENVIKQKRMPKQAILSIINSIDDESDMFLSKNLTVRDILANFFERASPKKADQLLEILHSSGASDPYLKGISETRR
jgi:hypothetical protein